MSSIDELREALDRAGSPTERRLYFVAFLMRDAGWKVDDAIVVGGSAIEIYTSGRYTTGDIDLVVTVPSLPDRILRSWGFREQGRIRYHDELAIVVDFVKPPYTGDPDRCQVLTTPYGPVRIAAIEDLLVKRLASAKHWRRPEDLEHAKILAVLYRDRIAWDYVAEQAARYNVEDVMANLRAAIGRE